MSKFLVSLKTVIESDGPGDAITAFENKLTSGNFDYDAIKAVEYVESKAAPRKRKAAAKK